MPFCPVADDCPRCRCREYTSVRGRRYFTFAAYDRICKQCGTRYTPRLSEGVRIPVRIVGGLLGGVGGIIVYVFAEQHFFPKPGLYQSNLELWMYPALCGMCFTFPLIGAVSGWLTGWALTRQPEGRRPGRRRDIEPQREHRDSAD